MSDPLGLPPWASLTTWIGMASFVVISVIRGWLRPKSFVDEIVAQLEKRLADRDELIKELRASYAAVDARNDLLADQVRQLLEVGHTSAAALQALPRQGS